MYQWKHLAVVQAPGGIAGVDVKEAGGQPEAALPARLRVCSRRVLFALPQALKPAGGHFETRAPSCYGNIAVNHCARQCHHS